MASVATYSQCMPFCMQALSLIVHATIEVPEYQGPGQLHAYVPWDIHAYMSRGLFDNRSSGSKSFSKGPNCLTAGVLKHNLQACILKPALPACSQLTHSLSSESTEVAFMRPAADPESQICRGCLGLAMNEIVSGDIVWALVSNYMIDFQWLLGACPALCTAGSVLILQGDKPSPER